MKGQSYGGIYWKRLRLLGKISLISQAKMSFSNSGSFNAFSIYNHWGFHNPTPGTLDFDTGAHNFTSIFIIAKELGMYVIVRPGPYVNAETNAGGYPLWLTTGAYGALRTDDDKYTQAWKPYWAAVIKATESYLITHGGNVIMFQIENELDGQWKDIAARTPNPPVDNYMQLLEDAARANGINVPLTYNAPNMVRTSWYRPLGCANSQDRMAILGRKISQTLPGISMLLVLTATRHAGEFLFSIVHLNHISIKTRKGSAKELTFPRSCNLSECTGTNGAYVAYVSDL